MTRKSALLVALALCLAGGTALAVSLGEAVVKTVTVGAVVSAIAGPADKAINTLTFNRKVPTGVSTKVVPVLSLGEKGYVGAAQVAGSQQLVSKTKAVLQLETSWSNKQYRIKVLMPMNSINPVGAGKVRGLGVSALVDVALSSNAYLLPTSRGWNTGDVLKAGAIAVATNEFGPQINSFLNGVLKTQGATPSGATKVVPYLSVGEKAYIGMMQVAGPASQVKQVKAVWQYEELFDRGRVRLRVLVPSNSLNPLKITRVKGVGCTAIIDAMVLRAREAERHPGDYGYFGRSALFVGPGEDPHYRPPGWDRGRKTGWEKRGVDVPPGLAKKQPPSVIIVAPRGEQHRERERERERRREDEGRRRGKGRR
ncbi:MAG: hypothetical protein ACE149_03635 [Armatimonadota bacterium]